MGHTRIGRLNRSKLWREVVAIYGFDADPSQIAMATLAAAETGFNEKELSQDAGYQKSVWLLIQLGIAAQSKDFVGYMRKIGIPLSSTPSLPELKARLQEAIDESCWNSGEMKTNLMEFSSNALLSAVESAVETQVGNGLFPISDADYQTALGRLGKNDEFSHLGQIFFSELTARGLQYYLSHLTHSLVGVSRRTPTLHEKRIFDNALKKHCDETAIVTRDYVVAWLRKHQYQLKDISDKKIVDFANFGIKKMLRAIRNGKD